MEKGQVVTSDMRVQCRDTHHHPMILTEAGEGVKAVGLDVWGRAVGGEGDGR